MSEPGTPGHIPSTDDLPDCTCQTPPGVTSVRCPRHSVWPEHERASRETGRPLTADQVPELLPKRIDRR